MDISLPLKPVILELKKKVNARAVVLLDGAPARGETPHIAGIKTPEVVISFEELTEYITKFAGLTKSFLKNIKIDDAIAPRSVYISTEEMRIYLFHFFIKTGQSKPVSIFLGLTVKKDLDAIRKGKENPWDIPQYVFNNAWNSIKEMQEICSRI